MTPRHERPTVWFIPEVQGGELPPSAQGLAAEARRIARELGCPTTAVLLGSAASRLAPSVAADVVYVGEDRRLAGPDPEARAAVLTPLLREQAPRIILLAATLLTAELAPRLAVRLEAGLASGCLRLDVDAGGRLLMLRPAFSGRGSCTVRCNTLPEMATIVPEALAGGGSAAERPPEIVSLPVCLDAFRPRVVIQAIERPAPSSLDVAQAAVVVAGGRGVGGPEGFALLEELAGLLGGAVGASRPAVDAGWSPPSRQVGSSGKQVAPRLYVACGISGAGQHIVGMRESELVVTINTDASSPLVTRADLALIGDVRAVLPAVLSDLSRTQPAGEEREPAFEPGEEPDDGRVPLSRIAVCLSRSVDAEAPFAAGALDLVPRVLNTADLNALQAALSIKDRDATVEVVALHMGPPGAEGVLREALSLGADHAVLLWDDGFASRDSLGTARILAAAVLRLQAQLVLCGSRGGDGQTGQVPVQLGELLEAAAVGRVLALDVDSGGEVSARRALEWGRRAVVRCRLPAVLALEPGVNRPRYPRLRMRLAARDREVLRWGQAELAPAGVWPGAAPPAVEVVKTGPPKPLVRGASVPAPELSADDRLRALLGGGAPAQGSKVVRGSPEQLADAFLRFLREHGLVRERG